MLYKEAIDWLFQQFPSYQNVGKVAYKPDLGNIITLCERLGIYTNKVPFIHIAGTNGKGSTSNMLASILMEAGYKTGTFTSPHILDFRERIVINNKLISEGEVVEFIVLIQTINWDIQPSFFEITFALALYHFNLEKCDICIIETGLGGRLDATNIISPILSIITNISLDHTDLLGDTLEKIAFEKAGIIKESTPVLIGEFNTYTYPVFQKKAKETKSILFNTWDVIYDDKKSINKYGYLFKNEKTVRIAVSILNTLNFNISENYVNKGISNLYSNTPFKARLQTISEKPKVIVDVAHNVAGIKELVEIIEKIKTGNLHIIYGASADKDIEEIIPLFPVNSNLYFSEFSNNRSLKIDELNNITTLKDHFKEKHKNISSIFTKIKNSINEEDTILITGSFFLISDFFSFFHSNNLQE